MNTLTDLEIDLHQALLMIARALDYVGIDDINHGHRVGYMAYRCAQYLGWEEKKAAFAYYTGLIHDCGVSSTEEHQNLVGYLVPENERAHCLKGYSELEKCPLLQDFSIPVLYHHTRWKDLIKLDISDYDKDIAAIVYIADRVDFLRNYYTQSIHHDAVTLQAGLISDHIQSQSGLMFEPDMVKAMCGLIATEGFWFNMDATCLEVFASERKDSQLQYCHKLSLNNIIQLARFVARIVDAKSSFTFEHSERVALLAKMLATDMDFEPKMCEMIYVAGLLHDIGKLRTPDEILNKNNRLTDEEYSKIRRHTVDTDFALRIFFKNSDIGKWASNHHERLDGSGYPYHKKAVDLDLPSRIIAIADIFQALSQKRPYREDRMQPDEIIREMTSLVENNKIDKDVFSFVQNDIDRYYCASIGAKEMSFEKI
jgi:putative nucleotidyltransferase with HDIG domain